MLSTDGALNEYVAHNEYVVTWSLVALIIYSDMVTCSTKECSDVVTCSTQ